MVHGVYQDLLWTHEILRLNIWFCVNSSEIRTLCQMKIWRVVGGGLGSRIIITINKIGNIIKLYNLYSQMVSQLTTHDRSMAALLRQWFPVVVELIIFVFLKTNPKVCCLVFYISLIDHGIASTVNRFEIELKKNSL